MLTISQWLQSATISLRQAGIESARLDCLMLLEAVTRRPRTELLAHDDVALTVKQLASLDNLLKERLSRRPMAYLLNRKQFFRHEFYVDERVLIPRSTSEPMVEWSIDNLAPRTNCIDVGTGSGCLAISLKLARSDIHMIASDISDEALAVARHNAKALAADVTFIQSDLFEKIDQRFSLVMANLPYVPISYKVSPEVLKEPKLAVYSKADGLEHYRRLAAQLPSVLDKPAFLLLEHSPEQFEQLKAIFEPLTKQVQSISNFTALFTIQ